MLVWLVAVLAAAPQVGNEIALDPAFRSGPAWSNQDHPRAATLPSNGTTLIVWRDARSGNADIFAARIDSSGTLLDLNGIQLCDTEGFEGPPSVAATGTTFVVTWRSDLGAVNARRISATGALLEPGPVVINSGTQAHAPVVACDASNCRFVWVGPGSAAGVTNLLTRTTNLTLTVMTPAVPVAASMTQTQNEPQIAANGTSFLVAWTETGPISAIRAARYDSLGTALDVGGFDVVLGSKKKPHVAASASKTMIAWLNANGSVDATWVLNSGALVPGPGAPPLLPGPAIDLDVTFSGTAFLVAAARDNALFIDGRSVNDALTMQTPVTSTASSSNALAQPALAPASTGGLLVVQWQLLGPLHIFAQQFDFTLTLAGPVVCVSRAAAAQDEPRVSFDGTTFVTAWNEARDFTSYFPATFGNLVELDGGPPGDPVQISFAHRNVCEMASKAGRTQVVFWEETLQRLEGNRYVAGAAAPLDGLGAPLVAASYNAYPGLAWGNGRALIAHAGASNALGMAFITPDGDAGVGFGIPFANGVDSPRVASDGNNFLVVWLGRNAVFDVNVYGIRIAANGTQQDAQPFVIAAPPNTARPDSVRVAFNGNEYLTVWDDARDGIAHIYGARVLTDGGVPDSPIGFEIIGAPGDQVRPDVVWDGRSWLVVWNRGYDAGRANIEGRLLVTSPLVKEPEFNIAVTDNFEAVPRVASNGAGTSLVVYQRYDPLAFNMRVKARTLVSLPPGTPCVMDATCASGFCVDGVCCGSACGGTNPNDCQACSVSQGAGVNGQCLVLNGSHVCRAATSTCDPAEVCMGGLACPSDVMVPACDAGMSDAGVDSGIPDSGIPDSGIPDSGIPDGGIPDSGIPYAGLDAGPSDGGATTPRALTVGCGCNTGGSSSLALIAFALLAISRTPSLRAAARPTASRLKAQGCARSETCFTPINPRWSRTAWGSSTRRSATSPASRGSRSKPPSAR